MPTRIHLSPDASLDEGGAIATKHLLLNEGNLMGHAWPNQEEGVFNLVVRGLSNGLRAPVASCRLTPQTRDRAWIAAGGASLRVMFRPNELK